MTGLPGSGKSTVAGIVKRRLESEYGKYVEVLEGDEVRNGLSGDLGPSREAMEEHARRVSYLAKVLARNGVISIVPLISPYRSVRQRAKEVIGENEFVEVFVKASLATCEKRDPLGLYAKARRGEVDHMVGIQDPYEAPIFPEIVVDTEKATAQESAEELIDSLARRLGRFTGSLS
jgi:adenylylsulfate kinase